MTIADSRVTIHMAARLDGFIARKDLPQIRNTVEFHSGDLAQFVNGRQTGIVELRHEVRVRRGAPPNA